MSRLAAVARPRSLVVASSFALAALAAVATLAPAPARADSITTEPSRSHEAASLPKLAVLGRAGVDSGRFGFGATYAADVMVRAREGLFFGGSFEFGTRVTGLEGCDTLANGCDVSRQRAGARAELHVAPRFVLDPWLGAYLGLVHVSYREGGAVAGINAAAISSYGAEIRAEAGLDLRIALGTSELRVGPVLAAGAAHGDNARLYAGLRVGFVF